MSYKALSNLLIFVLAIFVFCVTNDFSQEKLGTYTLRTKDGFLIVHNRRPISFSIEFKGDRFQPMESDHPKFMIDNKRYQIVVSLRDEFWTVKPDTKSEPTDEELLESHKTWESDYLADAMKAKLSVSSQLLELSSKKKMMFWSFPVPNGIDSTVSHYVFLTTVIGKDVLNINSAVDTADQQTAFKKYLIESIKTLKTSEKPFDIDKLAQTNGK